MHHSQRQQRRATILLAPLLLLTMLAPATPTEAVEKDILLGDSLEQFSRGTLQRTALAAVDADGQNGGADLLGAVQLAPVGVLDTWRGTTPLPNARTEVATVYLDGRIFVIGGVLNINSTEALTSTVLAAQVRQTVEVSGSTTTDRRGEVVGETSDEAWRQVGDLPTPRSQIAAAAVSRSSGGGGFIYAVGGAIDTDVDRLSTNVTSIGTVDAQGNVVWRSGPTLATPLQSAALFSFQAQNGKTYLYLLGGLSRRLNGGDSEERGVKSVFRAEVNTASGDLSDWERLLDDVPVDNDAQVTTGLSAADRLKLGMWGGSAFVSRVFAADGLGFRDMVYLIGGQIGADLSGSQSRYTSKGYQGTIDATGGLAWTVPGDYVSTLQSAWVGHTSVAYSGNVYVIGGKAAGSDGSPIGNSNNILPTRSIQAGYLEENGRLAKFGDNDFVRNNEVVSGPRYKHGTVLVPAGPTRAYVYVIGGTGAGSGSDQISNEVFYGVIGENASTPTYAPTGYFYSTVVDVTRLSGVNAAEGQLQSFSWSTTISRTNRMDVQLEYRYVTAATMPVTQTWIPITSTQAVGSGFGSVAGTTGENTAGLKGYDGSENPPARLVQFRARLTAEGASPLLRKVAIKVAFPGRPNLKFPASPFNAPPALNQDGKPSIGPLEVTVENRDSAEVPTRDAGFEFGGLFYVDLYIRPAGSPPPTFGEQGNAYALLSKSLLPANGSYVIKAWCNPTSPNSCVPFSPAALLQNPGSYEIYAYVDSVWPSDLAKTPVGNVNEGVADSPNERDNLTTTPLAVTIAAPDTPVPVGCDANPPPAALNCPVFPPEVVVVVTDTSKRFPIIMK